MKPARMLTIAVGIAAVAFPASAGATTFCVPTFHPACPAGGANVAEANLETAMGANGSDDQPDTAIVDAGTFTDPGTFNPSGSDPLVVQGAGPAATTLTSASTGDVFVVDLGTGNTRQVTLRDLTIQAPASFTDDAGAALGVSSDTLENVDLVDLNQGSAAISSIVGSLTYRGGTVRNGPGGRFSRGIEAEPGAITVSIEDVVLDQIDNAIAQNGPGTMNISRTQVLEPVQGAITGTDGTINVENTLITTSMAVPLYAFSYSGSTGPVTINADQVTMRHSDDPAAPVRAIAAAGSSFDARITVANSIMRDYAFAYERQSESMTAEGDAHISIRHSNFDPTNANDNGGDGTVAISTANINADPLFVSATDFRLQPGSPSIDAGDPAAATPTTDMLGLPRPIDGDHDGVAVRDQGAFEFDDGPPETSLTKKPKKRSKKRRAKFGFESDEPGSSFECKLDKREFTPCQTPLKTKKLKRRKHKFLVRATDASGNTDPTPAKARFKIRRH